MKAQNPRLRELFKTPQRKTYSLLGITTIVVGLFIFFALRPTFKKIADLNKEIKDKQEFLEEIDGKLETVNYLISQKLTSTSKLAYFETDFPAEEKGGFLVANFSSIADSYDIDLMNIEFNEPSDEVDYDVEDMDNVVVTEVTLNLEGDFADFEKYIEYLESFPRIFNITAVNYSKVDVTTALSEEDFKPMRCTIVMYIFHWTESTEES